MTDLPETDTPIAHQLRLYSRLQQAAHLVKKAADQQVHEAARLTTAQAAVMAIVEDGGAVSQRHIADGLGLNESAITAMIRKLTSAGYLFRDRDPNDARAWLVRLTPDGLQVLQDIAGPFNHINQQIDDILGKKDVEELATMLDALSSRFSSQD